MFTIKKKLLVLIAGVLSTALSVLAAVLISGERARITANITQNALHFAEFSTEPIAELYNLYYRSQAFALFQSEFQKILQRNSAVARVELATASGELLFSSAAKPGQSLPLLTDKVLLARLKVNKTSVFTGERVVYLTPAKHASAEKSGYRAENAENKAVPELARGEEVATIVYPLSDDRRRAIFHLSYAEVNGRMWQSLAYLVGLFVLGFGASLVIATRFAGTITAPLSALRAGAERIAKGALDTKITVTSKDETKLLADTFNQMTAELAAAVETKIEYERTAKELEVASEIQTSILPKRVAAAGLDLAVHFSPASEVGGDVYDCLQVDASRALFYLGDATGHGVPAGMVAALTNAIIATAVTTTVELPQILIQANQILHQKTKPNMFLTLLLFAWDQKQRRLTYVNAGHEPALIYRAKTGTVETTLRGSLGLGMLPRLRPEPQTQELNFAPGDTLLTFTDGIFEAQNPAGEMLGIERLKEIFAATCQSSQNVKAIETKIIQSAAEFRAGVPPADDITFILAQPV